MTRTDHNSGSDPEGVKKCNAERGAKIRDSRVALRNDCYVGGVWMVRMHLLEGDNWGSLRAGKA